MTLPLAPIAGEYRSCTSRRIAIPRPCSGQQIGQVRVERVAPADERVRVGNLDQRHPMSEASQRRGHQPIVGQILLSSDQPSC